MIPSTDRLQRLRAHLHWALDNQTDNCASTQYLRAYAEDLEGIIQYAIEPTTPVELTDVECRVLVDVLTWEVDISAAPHHDDKQARARVPVLRAMLRKVTDAINEQVAMGDHPLLSPIPPDAIVYDPATNSDVSRSIPATQSFSFQAGGWCRCGALILHAPGIGNYCTRTGHDAPCPERQPKAHVWSSCTNGLGIRFEQCLHCYVIKGNTGGRPGDACEKA